MAESPPKIRRNYPIDEEDDDGIMLFPNDTNDSSAFMSPALKSARPQHHHENFGAKLGLEYPNDEVSQNDQSPFRSRFTSKVSVAETKTTAQMTNETTEHPRSKDAWDFELELMTKAKVFISVLNQPIPMWNDMEEAVLRYAPQWKPSQRSKLIELWVKFMELKVLVEDYSTKEEDLLLEPTQLVGRVWYSIAQDSNLYQEVTFWIQDYHHKDRHIIYRPPQTLLSKQPSEEEEEEKEEDERVHDDSSQHAQFQYSRHHKLERAQRLFICYFQQAMPESLKAVTNMSKRKSSPTAEIEENNIVPENVSDDEDSDFEDDEEEEEDDYTYGDRYFEQVENRTHYTDASKDQHWIFGKFQSWLSCWEDPFGGSSMVPKTRDNQLEKNKGARRNTDVPDDELLQDQGQDASFWPCTTTDPNKEVVDGIADTEIRRSSAILQPGDDTVPDLNETDEGSSTLWVTFDSKQDNSQEDDEMTFLTMDTALKTPDKRGKKSNFYSPPKRSQSGSGAAASPQATPSAPQDNRKSPPSYAQAPPKNKLPGVTPKAATAASKPKKKKDKQEKGYGFLPEDWTAFKTKFRIASMIIKELE